VRIDFAVRLNIKLIGKQEKHYFKICRILSSRHRNRIKRFDLRVNLIAGYNYELKFAALS